MNKSELKRKLNRIKKHLDKAGDIFDTFPDGMQNFLYEYHNESGSLPYCIRWGCSAVDELIKDAGKLSKLHKTWYPSEVGL